MGGLAKYTRIGNPSSSNTPAPRVWQHRTRRFSFRHASHPQNDLERLQAVVAGSTFPDQAVVHNNLAAARDMVADSHSWTGSRNSLRLPAGPEGTGRQRKDQHRNVVGCVHFEDTSVEERP